MLNGLPSQFDWNSFSVRTDKQTNRHSRNRDRQRDTQTIQTDKKKNKWNIFYLEILHRVMLNGLPSQFDWNSFSVRTDKQTNRHSRNRDRQRDTRMLQTDRQTNIIFFYLEILHRVMLDSLPSQFDWNSFLGFASTHHWVSILWRVNQIKLM